MNAPETQAWSPRVAIVLGMFAVGVLIAGFGVWAVTSTIAGAVIATGQIEVDRNRQAVQHAEGGLVADLLVQEGSLVAQGDVLMRLDAQDAQSALSVAQGQLNELRARRARFEAERDGAETITFAADVLNAAETSPELADILAGQRNLHAARRDTLNQEVQQLTRRSGQIANQIEGIAAQQSALGGQSTLIRAELVAQQGLLERGLTQANTVLALQREDLQILGTLGELSASAAEAQGRTTEIELAILSLSIQRREDAIAQLREVRVAEEELAERVRSLTRQIDRLDLRAPVSGIVYGLTVFGPQTVIRPADPVLYLVPQDRPLVIWARIAPINVDQVFVGQDVMLHFPAFDSRTTPDLSGRVTQVSADAFVDQANGASFYRAEIVLNTGEVDRLGGRTLLPGMPVEVFIRTEDRTPLAYLLEPLAEYFNRAFRES